MLAVVGALTCGAVATGGVVAPSWAGTSERAGAPGETEPALLGGFALGDDVEGLVDPGTGAFSFALPAAGVSIGWDSRAAAVDGSGLGAGWSIAGLAQVNTQGGVRVSPASGGTFRANESVPSGLDGYLLGDVVFLQGQRTVPASSDGRHPALQAAFELIELGGVHTWFSADGDPLVRIDANGTRLHWEWAPGHRLVRAVDGAGVVTALDWSDPARVRVTTSIGPSRSVTETVELDGGRVAAVVDASGGRVQVGYTPTGLVERVTAVSGAATDVTWQRLADGRTAVDHVRVVDAVTGSTLSTRRWSADAGLASGWPAQPAPALVSAANDHRYATALTDGVTTIVSEFDANQLLLEREVEVASQAGSSVVQRQTYAYPEVDGDAQLPPQYGQPTAVTVSHLDGSGGHRDTSEAFEYDALGRLIGSSVHDGDTSDAPVRTRTTYDLTVAGDIRSEQVTDRPGADTEATTTRDFEYGPTGTLGRVTTTHPDGTVATATQTYDQAGNLTRALDGTAYAYNAINQPVSVTTPTGNSVKTEYWATRQRAAQTQSDGTAQTVFHWDGSTLLNDTHTPEGANSAGADAAASVTAAYLIGTGRHARTLDRAASTAYYEADHHGNVTELTDADAALTTSYDYSDYGLATTIHHATSSAGAGSLAGDAQRNPFQYAGEYSDPTGTQHLQARTYDPVSMRLTSVDPEPRYNKYHYADLNPITLADPTGRQPGLPTWASAVLAGAGVFMAGLGLVGAIGAYLTAAALTATATATTGSMVALGAIVSVAVYDAVAVGLTTAREFKPDFLDEETAFVLGVSSAVFGGVSMFGSNITRWVGRVEVNEVMALGKTSERSAEAVVRVGRRLVDRLTGVFDDLGVHLDASTLRKRLQRWAREQAEAGGKTWTAPSHYGALKDFEEKQLPLAYKTQNAGTNTYDDTIPRVWVHPSLGKKLAEVKMANAFDGQWPDTDLSAAVTQAKANVGKELESVLDITTGKPIFPNGYDDVLIQWEEPHTLFQFSYFRTGDEFGANGVWNHAVH